MRLELQFFGGRGSAGGNAKAGATAAANGGRQVRQQSKQSANKKAEVTTKTTAGQLTKMSESDREKALKSMPTGTIVSIRQTGGEKPIRYFKNSNGSWSQEAVYIQRSSRGTAVEKREKITAVTSSSKQLSKLPLRSSSYASVKYKK